MGVLFRIFCTGGFMSSHEARGNLKYSHYCRSATCIRPTTLTAPVPAGGAGGDGLAAVGGAGAAAALA